MQVVGVALEDKSTCFVEVNESLYQVDCLGVKALECYQQAKERKKLLQIIKRTEHSRHEFMMFKMHNYLILHFGNVKTECWIIFYNILFELWMNQVDFDVNTQYICQLFINFR